ncbi:hypothetical protein JTE90_002628 [Oedothorax gibbosus]|uniref:Uncharacterized protein n=1 Tax=Oedothorax gibbosus TaxID=931172 RepID=A0AAV6VH48_9ARAC|nr:hypothetical protein JTE90_002628 [Oedothorax gibbosus]
MSTNCASYREVVTEASDCICCKVCKNTLHLQQYSRRLNVEIANFPESENENITSIIENLMVALETDQMKDLVTYHRVPTIRKNKIKSIVVQFTSLINF